MANESVVTQGKLLDFYNSKIKPFLGGGLVMTELYNGLQPNALNSDTISSTTGTVVLADDIENYKFIKIETNYIKSDGSILQVTEDFDVSIIKNNYGNHGMIMSMFTSPSTYTHLDFGIYDKTHLALCYEALNSISISTKNIKIIGVS